jgi:ABC-type lipoprotein export system ATPase subunit
VDALADVSLVVGAHENVAVTGPSGSGKSTLLNLIGGVDRPSSGAIRVDGRDIGSLSSDDLAKYRRETIGFVFQTFRLLPDLTAIENVALPQVLAGGSEEAGETKARPLLDRVGLGNRLRHRPAQLSAGEQQRVALARALVSGPRILLADEPTASLPAEAATALFDLIAEIRKERGLTLIVATHDDGLSAGADRAIRLRRGRIA